MKKSKATIDDLAREVKGGFKKVEQKFDDFAVMVQGGFEGVDKRFDAVDKRFDKMEEWQRLANGKFDVLEHELLSIKKDLENVIYRHEFELIKERVKNLEIRVSAVLNKKK